jgi:small subunit ribosomal protein S12e
LSVEDALQIVLKKSLAYDGLARGLRESVKALDRNEAHLCVLAESVDEKDYVKLVEALCAEHKIPLIKVSSAEEVGKWVGLCKLDREGVPRKINECGVCVVKVRLKCI